MESDISELFTGMYYVDDQNQISTLLVDMTVKILENLISITSKNDDKKSIFLSKILISCQIEKRGSVDFGSELARNMKTGRVPLINGIQKKLEIKQNTQDAESYFQK